MTTAEYERGYRDGTEDAAQKMADIYIKLTNSCDRAVAELSMGNKMICDVILGILAPVQTEIRKLKP